MGLPSWRLQITDTNLIGATDYDEDEVIAKNIKANWIVWTLCHRASITNYIEVELWGKEERLQFENFFLRLIMVRVCRKFA